jgi:hypothetical protein
MSAADRYDQQRRVRRSRVDFRPHSVAIGPSVIQTCTMLLSRYKTAKSTVALEPIRSSRSFISRIW